MWPLFRDAVCSSHANRAPSSSAVAISGSLVSDFGQVQRDCYSGILFRFSALRGSNPAVDAEGYDVLLSSTKISQVQSISGCYNRYLNQRTSMILCAKLRE